MYRVLSYLLWPLWFFYTLHVAWREKNLRYFKQRLGFGYPINVKQPVWIHCASVGEVNTYLPLHQLLVARYPTLHFVITTTTPTAAKILAKQVLQNTQHVFLPIDTVAAVYGFFRRINPRLALIMETELWPELYRQASENRIPLVMVNARLSHKTMGTQAWLKKIYAQTLAKVSLILSRSSTDADAFIELGAAADNLKVIGNLKFAATGAALTPVSLGLDRPYVLAASTHDDEEWQLANLWRQFQQTNYLLVIVPRHPQRGEQILKKCQSLNLNIAVRSRGDPVTSDTQLYLADTLGELMSFIAKADVVIMGGSFIQRGGQNLLEPARLGKAIIVGPYMYNFAAETAFFLQHQACLQVPNVDALQVMLPGLLSDVGRRRDLGARAQQLLLTQQDVALRYRDSISHHYHDLLSL